MWALSWPPLSNKTSYVPGCLPPLCQCPLQAPLKAPLQLTLPAPRKADIAAPLGSEHPLPPTSYTRFAF